MINPVVRIKSASKAKVAKIKINNTFVGYNIAGLQNR